MNWIFKLITAIFILTCGFYSSAFSDTTNTAGKAPINSVINFNNDQTEGSLWQFIREHFALDHDSDNPQVKYYIYYYQTHTTMLQAVLNQSRYYLYNVAQEVYQRNMPMELALLPLIESGFRPFIISSAGASGMWQLMPNTAERFKINTNNWWFDGRADTMQSTSAALTYLKHLHDYFNDDWLLAIAAYNSGEGNVRNALSNNANNHQPTDFWNLTLPQETRDYVPKLLAICTIIANPERYGIYLPYIPNRPLTGKILLKHQLSLDLAAKLAGISKQVLQKLNPGFTKAVTPPAAGYYLILPIDRISFFETNFRNDYLHKQVQWRRYKVQAGDTLESIAKKTNTSLNLLQQVNKLKNNKVQPNQYIVYPLVTRLRIYTVKSGDTLESIAKHFNISVKDLANLNHLRSNSVLTTGQTLQVITAN